MSMMMCMKCGALFTYGNICPDCNSRECCEVDTCTVCGTEKPISRLVNGVCRNCLKKSVSVDMALAIGERYSDVVELNSFVVYFLGEDRIKEILMNAIVNGNPETLKRDAERFCMDDLDCFAQQLKDMAQPEPVKVWKRNKMKKEKQV